MPSMMKTTNMCPFSPFWLLLLLLIDTESKRECAARDGDCSDHEHVQTIVIVALLQQ